MLFGFVVTSEAAQSLPSSKAYQIGPNEVIRIQVYGEEDLSVERKVGGDGKIDRPLLGLIRVTGWTTEEIQADLTARLSAGYLKNPRVNVSIARHRNLYVSGEGKAAGAYPYEEGLTVQKAITMAGGFTEKASRTPKVLRTIDGKGRTIEMALDAPVLLDDIIVISQRFF